MTSEFSKRMKVDLSEVVKDTLLFRSAEFESWDLEGMVGRERTLIFIQKTLLGEISRFKCHDVVVWKYQFPYHIEFVEKNWKAQSDSFLTRFVFLHPSEAFFYKRKGLWWGLKGYLEIIICPFPWRNNVIREEVCDLLHLFKSVDNV